jgi:predicted Zn-dependent peptidase
MHRAYSWLVLAILFASSAHAAEDYQLDNGMSVVLEENHASPMIAAMVFVKAGAKYESPQNNGVTHFLEHLLFNGTATRTQEQLEPVIELYGGYINAFTRKEMTGYLVLMPKEYIDTGLAIVADMLFNTTLPEEKVEKERGIVTEEIRKDSDNPDYLVESAFAAFNHRGTPYARTVLGHEHTIATIPRSEILDYYKTYYVPNNMVALVIGDFTTAEMRSKVDRYFGETPPGRLPELMPIAYHAPTAGQFDNEYMNVPQPRFVASMPAPNVSHNDYPAIELWVDYLNTAGQSPLLARVVEGPGAVATKAFVSLNTMEEFTELEFDLTLKPDVPATQAIDALTVGLKAAAEQLPTDAQIAALVTAQKADEYGLKERLHYYGITRGPLFVVAGYGHVAARVENLAKLTRRDLQRATAVYAKNPPYRALYITKPPERGDEVRKSADQYLREVLPNGLTVIVKSNPDSKMFGAAVLLKNRSASEPDGQTGIVDFCQRMLTHGAGNMNTGDVSRRMAELGATLTASDNPYIPYDDFYTSPQFSFIKMSALDEFAPDALALLHTMITSPSMDSASTEQVRGEMLSALGMQAESPARHASQLFAEKLFTNGPLARAEMGTPETVGRITSADLRAFWQGYAVPQNTILALATSGPPQLAFQWAIETFGAIPAAASPSLASALNVAQPAGVVRAHEQLAKKQVAITIGCPTPGPSHADATGLRVMTSILSERLAENLREKRGLAYSVGAGISFAPEVGWLTCRMSTGVENYDTAVAGMIAEVRRMQTDIPTSAELLRAQNGIWGQMLTRRLARDNQCYFMALNEFLSVGYDFERDYLAKLRAVTSNDVLAVAGKYLSTDNYILATAGDISPVR